MWHVAVGSMQGGTCRQQAARCASVSGETCEVKQSLQHAFGSTCREAASPRTTFQQVVGRSSRCRGGAGVSEQSTMEAEEN